MAEQAKKQRNKSIRQLRTLNKVNRSLEVEKMRVMKDFQKQVRLSKKLQKIAHSP